MLAENINGNQNMTIISLMTHFFFLLCLYNNTQIGIQRKAHLH
jgi:hypothetical protein